ncbi:MAG: TonB-dependent receptor [Myxococcales bacterium]|nr:TonB-dependent receptor [Myxococcales bacterium]
MRPQSTVRKLQGSDLFSRTFGADGPRLITYKDTIARWGGMLLAVLCWGIFGGQAEAADGKLKMRFSPPKDAYLGRPMTLNGQVPNNEDLEEVYLFYRKRGAKAYVRVRMSLYRGEFYRAKLPASMATKAGLEFYTVGIDTDKKKYPLLGAPEKPIFLLFQPPPKEKKKDDDEGPAAEDVVFSAGRREQRLQKAPGVISVITGSELRAFGFRDLIEALRYMTGVDVNHNGLSPDIGLRGLNPRLAFGDKLVLLIDGQNMAWRQLNRNSTILSVDNVLRIEIIRGPGSTLWGANAISGVINVITKTGQALKGIEMVGGGSPLTGSYFLTAQGGGEVIGGLSLRASFSYTRDIRSPILAPIYEFLKLSDSDYQKLNNVNDLLRSFGGLPARYPGLNYQRYTYVPQGDEENNLYFMTQLSWKGLSLSYYHNRYEYQAPMGSFSILGGDDTHINSDRHIIRLSYLTALGSWGSLLMWASYDNYGFAPGSQYEANPLSTNASASQLDGASGYFAVRNQGSFQGYYPLCDLLPANATTPCIDRVKLSADRACSIYDSPQAARTPGSKPQSTIPLGAACLPTYQDGRFTRKLAGTDQRLEVGAQLSAQIMQNFSLNFGLEFEYLSLLQLYFPDIWESVLGLQLPYITNIHFSTFLQLQYNLSNFVEFTAGARFDYDQQYGAVVTPRFAAVMTPGAGFYLKLLYGNAFKAPSFQDWYYWRRNETYGNPSLRPESVHTLELQVGWVRSRLMAVSLSGFVSFFNDLITYVQRDKSQPLAGLEEQGKSPEEIEKLRLLFPQSQRPDGSKDYVQKQNSQSLTTYGAELEFRIFPVRGLNIRGNFGLYPANLFGTEEERLKYGAGWTGSLMVSYRYRFFSVALGALFVGPKLTDPRSVFAPGVLPANSQTNGQPVMMPFWTTTKELEDRYKKVGLDIPTDPSIETPWYVQSFATIQFLDIFGHMDFVIRLSNLLNLDIYDASDILFVPQKKFDVMAWVRVKY